MTSRWSHGKVPPGLNFPIWPADVQAVQRRGATHAKTQGEIAVRIKAASAANFVHLAQPACFKRHARANRAAVGSCPGEAHDNRVLQAALIP